MLLADEIELKIGIGYFQRLTCVMIGETPSQNELLNCYLST
jgi:hypothetical protein